MKLKVGEHMPGCRVLLVGEGEPVNVVTYPVNPFMRHVQIGNKLRIMARQMTAGEDIAMRRKKLRYRAWHRGTKEMDLILGPYADAHAEGMDAARLDRLEALMSEEDPPLLTWIMGQAEPPAHIDRAFLDEVIADHSARLAK